MSGSSFDLAEIGTYTGRAVRLYQFQLGDAVWNYATGDRPIHYGNAIWNPVQIMDEGLKQKSEATTDDFTVTIQSSSAVVQLFRGTPPSQPIKLTVREVQFGDTLAPIVWVGYVSSVKYRDQASSDIMCNTQTAFLNRKGLRLGWSRACPYALYDFDCGVSRAAFAEQATVTRLFGGGFAYSLVVDNPDKKRGRFQNGYIEWTVENQYAQRRAILVDNVTDCIVIGQVDGMTEGMNITMYPGCQRNPEDCTDVFDNMSNYGGFPMMPGRSPFDGNPVF
jgi:uncharacterized phage protein (TIGR02218 family)